MFGRTKFRKCGLPLSLNVSLPKLVAFLALMWVLPAATVMADGACCLGDLCLFTTLEVCERERGDFMDGVSCDPNPCAAPPEGACCLASGCEILTREVCDVEGGDYRGDGTDCAAGTCGPVTGACCFGSGLPCADLTREACDRELGDYQGDGTECSGSACGGATEGACCLGGGDCLILDEDLCLREGGDYRGDGTTCDPADPTGGCSPPDPTGSCCIDGLCHDLTREMCDLEGGHYGGDGTECDPVDPTAGEALLVGIGFDGTGNFLRPNNPEYQQALDLSMLLDSYNNNELCDGSGGSEDDDPPTVVITNPFAGSTLSGTETIMAAASDDLGVTQVEFFVDGGSIGVDSDDSDGWSKMWDTTLSQDGDYTISVEATDTGNQTAGDSVGVSVDNVQDVDVHVGDIDASTVAGRGGKWDATVTITVHDPAPSHGLVENAVVSGSWSEGASGSDSCVTDESGQCSIVERNISKSSNSVTFTVDDISGVGVASYISADNHDSDGDSDGTVIDVSKP